jgi:hypothetical protein
MPTYTVGKGPYRKGAIKDETEEFEDTPDLDCLRRCIQENQSDAAWFLVDDVPGARAELKAVLPSKRKP